MVSNWNGRQIDLKTLQSTKSERILFNPRLDLSSVTDYKYTSINQSQIVPNTRGKRSQLVKETNDLLLHYQKRGCGI